MRFEWFIPTKSTPIKVEISTGTVAYLVGANGSGKSALLTDLSKKLRDEIFPVTRVTAHRQSWLTSSSVDLTPKARQEVHGRIKGRDRRDESRWKDDFGSARVQVTLFDLINEQNRIAREIMGLLKDGKEQAAQAVANSPTPIEAMNAILAMSALSVRLSVNEDGDVFAQHGDGEKFSIIQLSDGERNSVLLAAQVLTAPSDTLFIIDEPERHLHRSITEPMLAALFEKRKDCAFVVATHAPELAASYDSAMIIIARSCNWQGGSAISWDVNTIRSGKDIPDEVRESILGARRRILFVEGEQGSLDFPLLSALFPDLSVKPLGSCIEVERAVAGLRSSDALHWLTPVGLIDRDDRTDEQVLSLETKGVFALEVSAIESIFYCNEAIRGVANAQARVFGCDAENLCKQAVSNAFKELDEETLRILAARRAERAVRNQALTQVPDWRIIKESGEDFDISVPIKSPFQAEVVRIRKAIEDQDLQTVVKRYSVKRTSIPSAVARALRFASKRHYEEAVVAQATIDEDLKGKLLLYVKPLATELAKT